MMSTYQHKAESGRNPTKLRMSAFLDKYLLNPSHDTPEDRTRNLIAGALTVGVALGAMAIVEHFTDDEPEPTYRKHVAYRSGTLTVSQYAEFSGDPGSAELGKIGRGFTIDGKNVTVIIANGQGETWIGLSAKLVEEITDVDAGDDPDQIWFSQESTLREFPPRQQSN